MEINGPNTIYSITTRKNVVVVIIIVIERMQNSPEVAPYPLWGGLLRLIPSSSELTNGFFMDLASIQIFRLQLKFTGICLIFEKQLWQNSEQTLR